VEGTTPGAANSYVESIKRSIQGLIPQLSSAGRLVLRVDGRNDYRVALQDEALQPRVELEVFPNPKRGRKGTRPSPEAVRRNHAMFPVDQLHQLLRHSCADHKRETIAFGRRLESILGRAHVMAVWKNFIKIRSERQPDRTTPATHLGLADERWRFDRVLAHRLFFTREAVSESALRVYKKLWTPGLPQFNRRHAT
jgi:hypothetical protein